MFDVALKIIWCGKNVLMLRKKVFHVDKNKVMLHQKKYILCAKKLLIFSGRAGHSFHLNFKTCFESHVIVLPYVRFGFDSLWKSYHQISLPPRAVRSTQPSILPRSVNEYRKIPGLTPGHRR